MRLQFFKKCTNARITFGRGFLHSEEKVLPIAKTMTQIDIDEGVVRNLFESFAIPSYERNVPVLSRREVSNLLKSIGISITDHALTDLLLKIDNDRNGEVDFEEFHAHYKYIFKQGEIYHDPRAIFNLIDKNKRGVITINDLTGSLTTSGRITEHEAMTIMRTVDLNNDDQIHYPEFAEMLRQNPIFCWKLISIFRVVFVIGGPASGKGTICSKLVEQAPMNILHVSSGDLLRAEIESGSMLGIAISDTMRRGELCDASVVITLLKKILRRSPGRLVLLDGFPRSLENAKDFVEQFGMGECCISFNCPHDIMISRIIERGKKSGRIDDNEETAKKRIRTFEMQSRAPVDYFKSLGSHIYHVDTTIDVEKNVSKLLELEIFSAHKVSE